MKKYPKRYPKDFPVEVEKELLKTAEEKGFVLGAGFISTGGLVNLLVGNVRMRWVRPEIEVNEKTAHGNKKRDHRKPEDKPDRLERPMRPNPDAIYNGDLISLHGIGCIYDSSIDKWATITRKKL